MPFRRDLGLAPTVETLLGFFASRQSDAQASREAVADVLQRRQERDAALALYPGRDVQGAPVDPPTEEAA